MKKTLYIVITIIVVIAIIWAGYYFYSKSKPTINTGSLASDVQTSVSDSVAKTNPFDNSVSPFSGYKNPFEK